MNKIEKNAGIIAGISLIVMAIAAGFAFGYVYSGLVNTSTDTIQRAINSQKPLFVAGVAAWLLIFVTDLIVSGTLYYFFRRSNRLISALTAMVRVAYTLVLGLAIIRLVDILPLLTGDDTGVAIQANLIAFAKIWSLGLIIFGFHLLGLGYLAMKSTIVPKFLAYLLYFAGVSYVLIHSFKQLEPMAKDIISSAETVLALPMALGEVLLAFWLIYNGLKRKSDQKPNQLKVK